jgi:hypothetical protein
MHRSLKWFTAPNPSACTDGYDAETPQAACLAAGDGSGHGAEWRECAVGTPAMIFAPQFLREFQVLTRVDF